MASPSMMRRRVESVASDMNASVSSSAGLSATASVAGLTSATGGEDTTARIVRKILAVTKWSPAALADRLSVPVTCVEACVARDTSGQLLRSHLRSWVRRGQGLPPLPQADFNALVRDADAREPVGGGGDDSVFAQLDDPTRAHFEYLQQSIGQNFVSILNDPDAKHSGAWGSTGNDWGSWLSRTFTPGSEASTGGGAGGAQGGSGGVGGPGSHGRSPQVQAPVPGSMLQQAMGGGSDPVQTMLYLTQADGAPHEFDAYLHDMTSAYRSRRELEASTRANRAGILLPSQAAAAAEASAAEDGSGRPALPAEVALEFASDNFDVRRVLRTVLPEPDDTDDQGGFRVAPPPPPAKQPGDEVHPQQQQEPPPDMTPVAISKADQIIAAVNMTTRDLDVQHDAVTVALMAHVHARSHDFFQASLMFEELTRETRGALSKADETRADVQDGGATIVHSFLRIAQASRRRRNGAALLAAVGEVERLRGLIVAIDDAIAARRFSQAAAALETAEDALAANERSIGRQRFDALDAAPERLAARRRQLRAAVAEAARRMTVYEDWEETDWAALGDVLHSARALGSADDVTGIYAREAALGAVDAALRPLTRAGALEAHEASLRALRVQLEDPTSGRDPHDAIAAAARTLVARAVHRLRPAAFEAVLTEALEALDQHLRLCRGHMQLVADAMDAAAASASLDGETNAASSPAGPSPASTGDKDGGGGGGFGHVNEAHASWMRGVVRTVAHMSQDVAAWYFDGRDDESILGFGPMQLDGFAGGVLAHTSSFEQRATNLYLDLGGVPGREAPGLWAKVRACLGQHVRAYFRRHSERLFERTVMAIGAEMWDAQPAIASSFGAYTAQLATWDEATIRASVQAAHNISGKPAELPAAATKGAGDSGAPPPASPASPVPGSAEGVGAVADAVVREFPGTDGYVAALCPGATGEDADAEYLTVAKGSDRFTATNSLLLLLQLLAEYDWFQRRFPLLSHDVFMRTQDAVKLFDGQCTSLVLGGGAVDQGILETVSPKHLAVAAQSIAFLAALTPLMQRRFARLANSKAMGFAKGLERVAKDLAEHRAAFFDRLVDAFRNRVRGLTLEPARWEAGGNDWVLALLKEALRYWKKGLQPLLGHCDVAKRCVIIGLVNAMSRRIRDVATKVESEAGVTKVREDLAVYKTNVENLLGYGVVACGRVPTMQAAATSAGLGAALATADAKESAVAVLEFLGCGATMDV